MKKCVALVVPRLQCGGVERGILEIAQAAPTYGYRPVVISSGGRHVRDLEALDVPHIELPVHIYDESVFPFLLPQIRRVLKDFSVDVVTVHSRVPARILAAAIDSLSAAERPVVITSCHGFYEVGPESVAMTEGERVIAVSDSLREYLLENFGAHFKDRIRVIHRGVDPLRYSFGFKPPQSWTEQFLAQYPELREKQIVTIVARLSPAKGQLDFLKAAAIVQGRRKSTAFLIVGESNPGMEAYAAELETAIRNLGLRDCIMTGYREDIREILAQSAVAVCSSAIPESFGRSMLEASSLGVPVVAYNHGGATEIMSELLPEGLVRVGAHEELAERILKFLAHPPTVRPNTRFQLTAMLDETFQLFDETISARVIKVRATRSVSLSGG